MSTIRESPGTTSRPHGHQDFDEWWYIAQGELSFAVGEKSVKIQACEGDIVFVSRGFRHSITTANSDDSLRLPVTAVRGTHICMDSDDFALSSYIAIVGKLLFYVQQNTQHTQHESERG